MESLCLVLLGDFAVLFGTDKLQVTKSNTQSVSAQVVDLEFIWEWSHEMIGVTMGADDSGFRAHCIRVSLEDTVTSVVSCALPVKTGG